MSSILRKKTKREISAEGLMTYGELDNGLHMADFMCCDDQEVTPFKGTCRVQLMHDGNMYITELPKRVKNKPLMRQTHSSFSLGKDKRYYFIFSLFADGLHMLRGLLIKEAIVVVEYILNALPILGNIGMLEILIGVLLIIFVFLLFSKPNKYPAWMGHIISFFTDTIVKYLVLCHLGCA